jgi:DnaK suppressor protein
MDEKRITHFENLLLRERDRALEALHRFEAEEAEPQAASAGDTVRGMKTPADAATDAFEQEADFASASRLSDRLAEVDAALARLVKEPDRFGRCDECGATIEGRRLELIPWAQRCASCARRGEEVASP